MATEQATAAKMGLPFQTVQEQGQSLQVKREGHNREDGGLKGPHIIQAGNLTNILGWVVPEQLKQEPDEELPQCWDHLKLVQSPLLGWGNPQQPDEFVLRQQEGKRREQQVPVLFEDMDIHSPEAEHTLLDRRQQLIREAKAGLERDAGSLGPPVQFYGMLPLEVDHRVMLEDLEMPRENTSLFILVVGSITPIHSFHKMSRRGTNWSHGEVLDLLDIWGEQRIQQVLQSSHRNMDTFQVIANEMAKRGHERTPQECRTKTKTLRRDYKKVKENNSAGKEPMTCPFYEQLDRILEAALPQPPERMPNFIYQEEAGGDNPLPCAPEEGGPNEESEDYHESRDQCDASAQFSIGLVDSVDSGAGVCEAENAFEEQVDTPQPTVEADHLPNPMSPAPHSVPGSPATTSSTADVHVSPSPSPLPGPTGLSAAERLANLRNRHKKTRSDLALELARAADRRMQVATNKILLALEDYAKADLEDREKHRMGTEQIITIMHRQTELLELLVQQQPSTAAAGSRHTWSPRVGQPSHRPTGPSSSRLGVSRRPLTPRARNRRRPQNYSS